MSGEVEYRVEFQIQRMQPGDEDFSEIGFGSSGGWTSLNQAVETIAAAVQNRAWETERWQPDPESIKEPGR